MKKRSKNKSPNQAIGIDIVEIKRLSRVSKRWGQSFLRKVYTHRELAYANSKRFPYQHLAARFAAKEAIFKALGEVERDFVGWKNVEILNDPYGKPLVVWHGFAEKTRRKRKLKDVVVSLSHTENYAVASAMLIF
ncbi:MAG: holo-[acyl-carrier-protein] synthase [Candidatus Omnitrophica bacterium CG07_land_8_20_14_0_80_50_8]|nr:MAG: holo-[acyl-carrier-protein] synthase [Candidatus Omnitrophica bacterium CG07_land_8_20_14_0_80_50_8]